MKRLAVILALAIVLTQCQFLPAGGWGSSPAVSAGKEYCPGGNCQTAPATQPWQAVRPVSAQQSPPAVCRVIAHGAGFTKYQTGVLVHKDSARDWALVSTAWHIFDEPVDELVVHFPGGRSFLAKVRDADPIWDLALLEIRCPAAEPLVIAPGWPGEADSLVGYGYPEASKKCGRVVGRMGPRCAPGKGLPFDWLSIHAEVPQGYSGGPIVDRLGRIVGLVSVGDQAATTGPVCTLLRKILDRTLGRIGRRPLAPIAPPASSSPPLASAQPPKPPAGPGANSTGPPATKPPLLPRITPGAPSVSSPSPPASSVLDAIGALDGRLDVIAGLAAKLPTGAVADSAPGSLLTSAMPAALTALGISCPPAAVLIGATWLARRLWRRRQAKRSGGAADAVGSFPRDDTEAAQFLRLSAAEGRSPLHDALVGRIAFDELDRTIDSEPDRPEAHWARALKQQLEARFNEMAPPAVAP